MSDHSAASATAPPPFTLIPTNLQPSVHLSGVLDRKACRFNVEIGSILEGRVLMSDHSAASATAPPPFTPIPTNLQLSVHLSGVLDRKACRLNVEIGSILEGLVVMSDHSAASATAPPPFTSIPTNLQLSVHLS